MSEQLSEDRRKYFRLRLLPRLVRSLRKRWLRMRHGDKPFVAQYYGVKFRADFEDMVSREIALRNFETAQLACMIEACKRRKPDLFIDVGANAGLYTCVLVARGLVPRALLFEPDRRNLERLRDNIGLNRIEARTDLRPVAVSAKAGRLRLVPGPGSNTGTSRLNTASGSEGYEVEVVALDDVFAESGKTIALKMDVEGHEVEALRGMERTLRGNSGVVQIETSDKRDQVAKIMEGLGFRLIARFMHDHVFEK